jgi:hypothetical protein
MLSDQRYKDANAFTFTIAYSIVSVKPSIFGIKSTINDFLNSIPKCKPLVHKA